MSKFLLAGAMALCVLTAYLSFLRIRLQRELVACRAEASTLTDQAASLQAKIATLEGDLGREKERADRLTAPRTVGNTVPLAELAAVPELYANKEFQVTGRMIDKVTVTEPVTWFRVLGDGGFIHCVFKPQDLDATSRRLLVSKEREAQVRVHGRYVPNGQGPFTGRTHTGYEFVVLQVVE